MESRVKERKAFPVLKSLRCGTFVGGCGVAAVKATQPKLIFADAEQ